MADEARSLKQYGELPESLKINETELQEEEVENQDDFIKFEVQEEEETTNIEGRGRLLQWNALLQQYNTGAWCFIMIMQHHAGTVFNALEYAMQLWQICKRSWSFATTVAEYSIV